MTESVVSIQGLVKRYGAYIAVNGINLEVGRGEVFGLLGPNGAGKTTTLECLEGMRKADGGNLRVAGCDPQSDEKTLRSKLGVQLQTSSLPDSIRVDEAIALICAWHGHRQMLVRKSDHGRQAGILHVQRRLLRRWRKWLRHLQRSFLPDWHEGWYAASCRWQVLPV